VAFEPIFGCFALCLSAVMDYIYDNYDMQALCFVYVVYLGMVMLGSSGCAIYFI
jgi:hypothetical protein